MPSKFVRLKELDFEIAINVERVNAVIRTGDIVVIYFTDDKEQSRLTGAAAESFWRYIASHSFCIHQATSPNKNAETLATQDSSVLPEE